MHGKAIEIIHIIVFSLIYSKWGMCLKKKKEKKKEIIEVMKFDVSKCQYAIIFILYKLLHFVIIIHIKHALPPCQNIKACIDRKSVV